MAAAGWDTPKTVIFLGAGASKADGAPLQGELLSGFFTACQDSGSRCPVPDMRDELATYFEVMWGIDVRRDVSRVPFPTFEEVLGILDIAAERNESFRGMRDDPHATGMQELRDHLTTLIGLILDEKLKEHDQNHVRLLGSLRGAGCIEQVVFISLNYDLLIDNAIEDDTTRHGGQRVPDYAVDFTPRPGSGNRPFEKAALLLKIHGSLNWLFCPSCSTLSLFPHYKIAAELAGGRWRCAECHGLAAPIIIPPTFFKVMSNFYLQQVWKRAEEELRHARRIIFCGYSFPDADVHIKYLLKRAVVNRTGPSPAVFIVNRPSDRSIEEHRESQDRKRYERFFRQKDQVHWTNLSFQDFAANPQSIEDQDRWQ